MRDDANDDLADANRALEALCSWEGRRWRDSRIDDQNGDLPCEVRYLLARQFVLEFRTVDHDHRRLNALGQCFPDVVGSLQAERLDAALPQFGSHGRA